MPFTPLPDKGPEKPQPSDLGLLLIRLVAVAAYFYYQLAEQLGMAKSFVWNKAPWPFADAVSEMGLPLPGAVATAIVLLMTISSVGIILGIFTRANAAVLLVANGFLLIAQIDLDPTLTPQALVVYLAIFLGLTFGGAGRVSLDYILAGRKEAKRKTF